MRTECLINGEWVGADSGKTFEVTNPATGRVLTSVPRMGGAEARRAVDAAFAAWPAWRSRTAADRGKLVGELGRAMMRDQDRLAGLMTAEQGKPLGESKGEIAYAASFLEWASEEGKRLYGEIIPASAAGKRILVLRQSVGVAAIITPWNFPAAMITRKLGPALACGCPVVIKPAEDTPLSALAIAELAEEVGIPAGVVNVITGEAKAIGGAWLDDDRVRKLSFTGSTEVGRVLMKGASEHLLRLSLELGGHAPFLVFDDADLDKAVAAATACKFRNAGQTCICANRFIVQEGIHDAFVERFAEAINDLKVGEGTGDGVSIGPLINDAAVEKVESHVRDAIGKGGTVRAGGERVRIDGLADRFYAPTLITGMTPEMKIFREETFGPVAAVTRFKDEDEGVRLANDSEYGLAAYFFTRDASRLMRVAEALEYGIVGANDGGPSTAQAPFGGVKHSGFGREGGRYVMDEYTEIKYVSWGL
ncbi:MAG: NAD-dependent succinate-semialdehyde dehydrogenase [Phycisphaerales bacterium]|nr:NAD-dependent succinate-semialdehyde dehydrogenase [Planctomycetota bacterium]MCH8508937.1 NAD-dependent succinate-semialdehyde dehydrogenase [Phycisphaerales bacterium]